MNTIVKIKITICYKANRNRDGNSSQVKGRVKNVHKAFDLNYWINEDLSCRDKENMERTKLGVKLVNV